MGRSMLRPYKGPALRRRKGTVKSAYATDARVEGRPAAGSRPQWQKQNWVGRTTVAEMGRSMLRPYKT